jgi:predicted small secreted protein
MRIKHIRLARLLAPWLLAITLLAVFSVGCNTARGFGQDVENAGESIQSGTK